MDTQRVVWSEGMFISPQHFQQQERYLLTQFRRFNELAQAHQYGLSYLELDTDAMAIGKIGVRYAEGVFADGTPFHLRQALMLNIPEDTKDSLVYLTLPVHRTGRVDVGEENEERRFKRAEAEIFDSSRSSSEPLSMAVAELNIKLQLEDEQFEDYTSIPIVLIKEYNNDQLVIDRTFIPPCLTYKVSQFLDESIKDLLSQMQARATAIARRLTEESSGKSFRALVEDDRWIQAIGRWLPLLRHWSEQIGTPPQKLYEGMLQMVGEFHALNAKLPPEYPTWNNRNLYQTFSPILADLRLLLREIEVESVSVLQWDSSLFDKRRLLRTQVADRKLYQSRRFILSVTSSLGAVQTAHQFPLVSKMAGQNHIAEIVRNALSGIELRPLSVAPAEIKSAPNASYFEIDTASPFWKKLIEEDDLLALHVDSQLGDVDVELYLIR
ncbi:Uncharacterised protein [BD1-7 clade bacterium]|uniref:Type VI secretion system-associated protein n=1 Tax=BD1-7 clade bacterium TaxID=2029982 RepID=A0A5S9QA93_9GAMM|nr:Uncharacterised protein [BD1-7 clade bacterium]CAA0114071.1 Uncharacterised protein [BD1-7 clade bacterium]CAA0115076.1 Uncharacterised protein [BD1-7 clade bacterium]